MSCPSCEVHAVVYGVTKKSQARPKDDPIPTSSRKIVPLSVTQSLDHTGTSSQDNPTVGNVLPLER